MKLLRAICDAVAGWIQEKFEQRQAVISRQQLIRRQWGE